MRKVVVLFLLISNTLSANVLDISPYFQGVWRCVNYSTDQGKTILQCNSTVLCTVYNDKLVVENGNTFGVKTILPITENDITCEVIFFVDAKVFLIVSVVNEQFLLVRMIRISSKKEVSRLLIHREVI